jgi:(p)ppGpp synthase/HD superfamily hydrolase
MDVASILMKNEASEEVVVAGLLHDVVEDAGVELHEIEEFFGKVVSRLVEGASEPEEYRREMSSEERKRTWKARKSHTVNRIKDADYDLKLLSCADKLSNIRDLINDYNEIGEKLWHKLNATQKQQCWYYKAMLKAFENPPYSLQGKPVYNQLRKSVDLLFEKTLET